MKKLAPVLLAALMLTLMGCSRESSSGPLTPDQVFSGGSPDIDIEGYQKPSSMLNLSSQQIVTNIRIGWNLGHSLENCLSDLDGNTLPDMTPDNGVNFDETLYGNPRVSERLFQALTDSGVNAVRLPITWREHIDESGNIDEKWLNRVKQVVDYAYNCGMYVIVTVYHDGASDTEYGAWIRNAVRDFDGTLARYKNLWAQIADKFRTYNERLLFESMNDVEFIGVGQDRAYEILNSFNQTFVDTVRHDGANNMGRHLLIAGYAADIRDTCDERFVMPEDYSGKLILSVHYYTPKTFCLSTIQNYWGTNAEQDWMESQITALRTNFVDNGIPVIITEYGAKGRDKASRVFFCEMLNKLCRDNFISAFLWDDGSEFDRTSYTWNTPELLAALKRSTSGHSYVPEKITETAEAAPSEETSEIPGSAETSESAEISGGYASADIISESSSEETADTDPAHSSNFSENSENNNQAY